MLLALLQQEDGVVPEIVEQIGAAQTAGGAGVAAGGPAAGGHAVR